MDNWKDGIPLYCLIVLIAMAMAMAYDAFEKHEARAARPEHITVTTMNVDPRCVITVDKP